MTFRWFRICESINEVLNDPALVRWKEGHCLELLRMPEHALHCLGPTVVLVVTVLPQCCCIDEPFATKASNAWWLHLWWYMLCSSVMYPLYEVWR